MGTWVELEWTHEKKCLYGGQELKQGDAIEVYYRRYGHPTYRTGGGRWCPATYHGKSNKEDFDHRIIYDDTPNNKLISKKRGDVRRPGTREGYTCYYEASLKGERKGQPINGVFWLEGRYYQGGFTHWWVHKHAKNKLKYLYAIRKTKCNVLNPSEFPSSSSDTLTSTSSDDVIYSKGFFLRHNVDPD